MNKKAFTIVELLGVLAIIAILSLIIIPSVVNYLNQGKQKYNNSLKNQLILAAKNKYGDSREYATNINNPFNYMTASMLSSTGYIDNELVDSEKQSCEKESFVTVFYNVDAEGNSYPTFYACMKCGDNSYITENEKIYCNHKYEIEKDTSITCSVKQSANGALVTVNDPKSKYSTIRYGDFKDSSDILNKQSLIKLKKYGYYSFYLTNNVDNSIVVCGGLNIKEPTEIKTSMYFVSQEDYEKYKNGVLPLDKRTKKYDGNWQSGYVFVQVDNYDQFKSLKLDGKDLIQGNSFWLDAEGAKSYSLIGLYDAIELSDAGTIDKEKSIPKNINTKLDRTGPVVTLSNSSGGNWTTSNVTVSGNIEDQNVAVERVEYGNNGASWSNWSSSITKNGKMASISKSWSSDVNQALYVRAYDALGNVGKAVSTIIKIDKTPPTCGGYSDGGWHTSAGGNWCHAYYYYFSDSGSGLRYKPFYYRYCYGCSSASQGSWIKNNLTWDGRCMDLCIAYGSVKMEIEVCDNVGNCSRCYGSHYTGG